MNKLVLKLPLIVILIVVNSFQVQLLAQEYGPFSVGIKSGWPQVAGLNAEYLTPLINKKVSVDMDGSYVPLPLNEFVSNTNGNIIYTTFTIGIDYYFFKQGRGIYAGLGFNSMNIEVNANQIDSIPKISFFGGFKTLVSGTRSKVINSYCIKIGGKYGEHFYFRWEFGYKIATINNNDEINVFGSIPGLPIPTPVVNVKIPSLMFSGPTANIGFGYCF